jgi:hypothetical protein
MKLVREHIYEKFEEQSDPIEDMGIGSDFDIAKYHPISMEIQNIGFKFTSTEKDIEKKKTLRYEATKKLPENLREVSFNMSPGGYFRINGRPKNKFKQAQTLDFALNYIKDNLFMKGSHLYKSEDFKIKDEIAKFSNKRDFEKYVKNKFKNKVLLGNYRVLTKNGDWNDMSRDLTLGKEDTIKFDYERNRIILIIPSYNFYAKEIHMIPTRTYKLREKEIGT